MDEISKKAKQLVPYMQFQNFEEIFEEMTAGEKGNVAFLLRMELKRLNTPCIRIMDFRNDGDTEEFVFNNIRHFLQKEDIEDFKNLLELYGNVYTNGLQEEVTKNHNQRKKQKRLEALQNISGEHNTSSNRYDIEEIKFTNYAHRREERMFFSSPIAITYEDNSILIAKTSDLSCSGIKILLPHPIEFTGKHNIKITFTGLISSYPNAQEILTHVPYEVLGIETREGRAWLKTRCLHDNKDFERFILSFQESNKFRYRIDLDYFSTTLNNKAIQYQYIPKIPGIVILFSNDFDPKPIYALKSNYNHEDLNYWRDERSDDKIASIFNKNRINALLSKPENKQYTYIYAFKHTLQNHTYFISATLDELKAKGLLETFFKMSKGKSSFRVYKFNFKKIKLDAITIRDLIADTKENTVDGVSAQLEKIGYLGQLTRIDTEKDHTIYEQYTSSIPANALQEFTNDTENVESIKLEYLQYITPRKEHRYEYQTAATVSNDYIGLVQGWTRDISTTGLQIELSHGVECFNGDVILVTLPKFQSMKKKLPLTNIPYEVIYVNSAHTILHLKLRKTVQSDTVSQFLDQLIKANSHILKQAENISQMSTMSKALRNLSVTHIFSTPIALIKGKNNRLGYYCKSSSPSHINVLSKVYRSSKGHSNLFPLFSNNVLKNILAELPGLKLLETKKQFNILVRRVIKNDSSIMYEPCIEEHFKTIQNIVDFVSSGLKNGYFGAFTVFISSSSSPDLTELDKDLQYLKRCAIHKFNAVEKTIWNILGYIDIVEITESIYAKYNFEVNYDFVIKDSDLFIE